MKMRYRFNYIQNSWDCVYSNGLQSEYRAKHLIVTPVLLFTAARIMGSNGYLIRDIIDIYNIFNVILR